MIASSVINNPVKGVKNMNASAKNECLFWQMKIEKYIQEVEEQNERITVSEDTNWNLTKSLPDDIRISVFPDNDDSGNCTFTFSGPDNFEFHYSDCAEKTISLFYLLYNNFEKDIIEIKANLIPIRARENEKRIEQNAFNAFAQNLMKDSNYEWKLKNNLLQVKLNCQKILEFALNTSGIEAIEKEYKTSDFIDFITKTDEQLCRIPFFVRIENRVKD